MNKRRLNVSPSQVKKFETCPRLTSWQLCTRVKPPPSPPDARALGERAHALVEAWLLEGERPDPTETIDIWRKPTKQEAAMFQDEASDRFLLDSFPGALMAARFGSEWRVQDRAYVGAIALAHVQTVPPPKHPGLEVEVSATVTTSAATYKARADYRARAFGVSTIGDHKFVGDLSYALTNRPGSTNGFGEPNYLGDDAQAVIQAKAEFESNPDLSCVSLAWHYTQTKAVRGEYPTRVVRLTLTREQVNAAMEAIDPVAAQIAAVFDLQIQPHALPPRLAAAGGCDRLYGRPCEFTSHCNLTPQERQDQHMNTPQTSQQRLAAALENAKRITAGAFANAAPATPATPPEFVVPTFAPPPAFAPPAFVVPTFAPPAFALPAFVGTSDTGPMLSGDRFVAAILADMDPEDRARLDPINPPEAPPNDGTFGPVATAKRVEEVEIPGGDIDALDRAAAKKICVQRGLVQASSRLGVEALRDLIRKSDAGVPIERVDPAQFVPSVSDFAMTIESSDPPSFVAPPPARALSFSDAIAEIERFVSKIEGSENLGEAFRVLYRVEEGATPAPYEIRNVLDGLNEIGDKLRAMIGA